RLGADLHHREVRRVVDEQRRLADLTHAPGQSCPVVVGHAPTPHVGEPDLRLGRQHAHHDLGAAHLQREDDAGHAVLDGTGAGEVQPQGRLPHTGTRGDDDHLPGMQPVGDLVEVGETGRNALRGTAPGGDGVDLVHRRLEQFLQRDVVLAGASFGDLVDGGLRAVDDLVDVAPVAVVGTV